MTRTIELYGVKAEVPESEHFRCDDSGVYFVLRFTDCSHFIPIEENEVVRKAGNYVALAADHARCWWEDRGWNGWENATEAQNSFDKADAWAEIARRARGVKN